MGAFRLLVVPGPMSEVTRFEKSLRTRSTMDYVQTTLLRATLTSASLLQPFLGSNLSWTVQPKSWFRSGRLPRGPTGLQRRRQPTSGTPWPAQPDLLNGFEYFNLGALFASRHVEKATAVPVKRSAHWTEGSTNRTRRRPCQHF
jgi:hypothetical protein